MIECRQVVEARGHVGVLRPQSLLLDRQRPLVERLGLGIPALGMVNQPQVVEADGHGGVLRPQGLLPNRQRPLVKRLSLGVTGLGAVKLRQIVETRGEAYVIRPKRFRLLERGLKLLLGFGVVALLVRRDTSGYVALPLCSLVGSVHKP